MIPEIKKILYATDLSQNSSSYVFSYAIDMARRHNASIVIMHAVEPVHHVSYAGSSVAAMMKNSQKQEQEASLEEIKKRIESFCKRTDKEIGFSCSSLVSKILVPLGNPVEEILKAADEEGCDTIVLGSHRKGFLKEAFLGNVARSVLERTRKPAFVVPLPSENTYMNQDKI
ncbi:MAG: universal stress protein [Syntrophales bacterium LBB04]|nr:universal stress protein [Syntrophales bacterium LBB04]